MVPQRVREAREALRVESAHTGLDATTVETSSVAHSQVKPAVTSVRHRSPAVPTQPPTCVAIRVPPAGRRDRPHTPSPPSRDLHLLVLTDAMRNVLIAIRHHSFMGGAGIKLIDHVVRDAVPRPLGLKIAFPLVEAPAVRDRRCFPQRPLY